MRMVCDTVNPSFLAASCCNVEVVKGGAGERFNGFFDTLPTVKTASLQRLRKSSASSCVAKRLSSSALTSTPMLSPLTGVKTAVTR